METYDTEYDKAFYGEEITEDDAVKEVESQEEVQDIDESTDDDEAPEIEEAKDINADEHIEDEPIEEQTEDEDIKEFDDTESKEQDEETEPKEEPKEESKRKIIWNGKEIELTDEELTKLAQQGFDYTFKTQAISKYKKKFEELEKSGINDEDLQILTKIKQGDKEALAYLMKQQEIDPFDVSVIENPNPTLQKSSNEIVISEEVKPLMEQVSSNTELLGKLQQAESYLPDAVIKGMAQSPELFYGVVSEVESGTFDEVMPQLQKQLSGMSNLDREYVMQNPNQFANLYMSVKNNATKKVEPQQEKPKEKPNMAEVGIKKSNTTVRQENVIKDAFNSNSEYQKILERVKRQQ